MTGGSGTRLSETGAMREANERGGALYKFQRKKKEKSLADDRVETIIRRERKEKVSGALAGR